MNKHKKLNIILWSTLAPASVAVLITPPLVMMNKSHIRVTDTGDYERDTNYPTFAYQPFLIDAALGKDETIKFVEFSQTFGGRSSCNVRVAEGGFVIKDNKQIILKVELYGKDNKKLVHNDFACFNITFAKYKNGKRVWKNTLNNFLLTYTGGDQ